MLHLPSPQPRGTHMWPEQEETTRLHNYCLAIPLRTTPRLLSGSPHAPGRRNISQHSSRVARDHGAWRERLQKKWGQRWLSREHWKHKGSTRTRGVRQGSQIRTRRRWFEKLLCEFRKIFLSALHCLCGQCQRKVQSGVRAPPTAKKLGKRRS